MAETPAVLFNETPGLPPPVDRSRRTFRALRFGMLVAVASAQKKRTLNSAFKNNENNVG